MTKDEEQALIARILGGDTQAFEEIVLEHQKNVYNLALKMTGNADDAFDVSQDTFLRAYNALSSFRGDSRLSVWLYRLTSNICIDLLRKKKRRGEVSLSVRNDQNEEDEIEIPDDRYAPETALERKELRRSLREGLASLPENYRQILTLREISGLSYEEIAQVLELEPGTVKSRLFRARKQLCTFLSDNGNISRSSPSKNRKEV